MRMAINPVAHPVFSIEISNLYLIAFFESIIGKTGFTLRLRS